MIKVNSCIPTKYFNPRSLAGATILGLKLLCKPPFQSTLPRGSDRHRGIVQYGPYISIHAPSRERRHLHMHDSAQTIISIHAPSRERLPTLSI